MNLCTQCSSDVRPRQEALQCDICQRWTHRTCGTGMTRIFYRQLVRDGLDFNWNCPECNEGLQRTATNDSLPPPPTQWIPLTSVSQMRRNKLTRSFIHSYTNNLAIYKDGNVIPKPQLFNIMYLFIFYVTG